MFVEVDVADVQVEGFSYTNAEGYKEYVILPTVGTRYVVVKDSAGAKISLYRDDLTKLITALQAAHDHLAK
jgi:hypothetical protein